MVKSGRRSLVRKIVLVSLIVMFGTLAALSGSLVLSIKPPTGNPTLESIKSNPGHHDESKTSASGNEALEGIAHPRPASECNPSSGAGTISYTGQTPDTGPNPVSVPSPDTAAADEIYYFLVAGFDAVYANTDTIMLTGFNITDKTLHVLSIPRDTMTGSNRFNKKINAAWEQGGIAQLEEEVAELTGIGVNRYILISLEGMEKIVDALGGIDFNVPCNMNYDDPLQNLHIHLRKGQQRLTGKQVLQLARYRNGYSNGDIGRISIQQELIKAIATQARQSADMAKLSELVGLAMEYFETDLTMGEMLWLMDAASAVSLEDIHSFTLPGRCGTVDGLSYWLPDHEALTTLIREGF